MKENNRFAERRNKTKQGIEVKEIRRERVNEFREEEKYNWCAFQEEE